MASQHTALALALATGGPGVAWAVDPLRLDAAQLTQWYCRATTPDYNFARAAAQFPFEKFSGPPQVTETEEGPAITHIEQYIGVAYQIGYRYHFDRGTPTHRHQFQLFVRMPITLDRRAFGAVVPPDFYTKWLKSLGQIMTVQSSGMVQRIVSVKAPVFSEDTLETDSLYRYADYLSDDNGDATSINWSAADEITNFAAICGKVH